ncbi:lipoprotein/thioredoxin [Elizabethkingia sp. HvH-WGS333]|uniref:TlpA family protein disulfide reductase n=1 Tax=Elizabethkingia TaxID=308865 RepID=UPI0007416698|nr:MULTISPECIES: TlpA disulfide reductase family protein [Elizabethkingia]KUG10349.1 lipoprotein/thioredoxin [Elizabethkingia miricola]MCL1655964.1 TlpA family protein disulfide reductase [Elizabethkingia miricola]OIK47245.1 lipoprotein/thioredoxin [Elizabethkingia sp. HvH-WGS333]
MKCLNSFFLVILGIYAHAQTFNLNATFYQKDGKKISLASGVTSEKYFDGNFTIINGKVKDQKILFKVKSAKDKMVYPFNFLITGKDRFYFSEDFYMDSRAQSLIMGNPKDSANYDIKYSNENSSVAREVVKFKKFYKDINTKSDSLRAVEELTFQKYGTYDNIPKDIITKSEEIRNEINEQETIRLLDFIKKNPKSFVGFWQLVKRFQRKGYKPIFEDMYNHLSTSLKDTYSGRALGKSIYSAKILAVGQKFPVPKVTSIDQKPVVFKMPEAKIILVDFWFSHCKPCREEMPKLVELYGKYKSKGFEIVSIATDITKALPYLQKTVKEDFNMTWANYLDENRKQSDEWVVTYFPSKFLLDSNGIIVQKDISVEDLEKLLAEKLK